MYKVGDVIGQKYTVVEICENQGGMGTILFVEDEQCKRLALKYCEEELYYSRFRREVRLVKKYNENTKVIQILHCSLNISPPFFVMPVAEKGNLSSIADDLRENTELQEKIFFRMADCLEELHKNGDIHRDVKPDNFLMFKNEDIVISDLGLAKEPSSDTRFTQTMAVGGTVEFAPPEYYTSGGFKEADVTWDIYSLGKSYYRLLTGKDARFVTSEGIDPNLFYIIQKCSKHSKGERYQTIAALKQSLRAVFNIINKNVNLYNEYDVLLEKIEDGIEECSEYSFQEVNELLEMLTRMELGERNNMLKNFPVEIIRILSSSVKFKDSLGRFILQYKEMFDSKTRNLTFSYAEKIANNMKIIFYSDASDENKVLALRFAIHAAERYNRFAAMVTCEDMIESITSDDLAFKVAEVITECEKSSFLVDIELSNCKNSFIKEALKVLKSKV
ncbi:protein kinase domain-containing protein [Halobacteriovorax marinus]|uniref:protein kinase domain-containing protein n=1 Tax=Halobacteriovorax marinus TaxID=97084 RepID=UPI003A8E3C97